MDWTRAREALERGEKVEWVETGLILRISPNPGRTPFESQRPDGEWAPWWPTPHHMDRTDWRVVD